MKVHKMKLQQYFIFNLFSTWKNSLKDSLEFELGNLIEQYASFQDSKFASVLLCNYQLCTVGYSK